MNLFICVTPLQILICEKIIENYHNDEFEFAIIENSNDKKIKHYINHIKTKAKKTIVFKLKKNSKLASLKALFKVRVFYANRYYENVFLVTPKDFIPRMILNNIKFNNLFSFDDGAANIFKDSWVYESEFKNLSYLKRTIRYFLERFFSLKPKNSEYYMAKIKLHFTIFKNLPNIAENTKFLSLLDDRQLTNAKNKYKKVSIFLGQPIYGNNVEKNQKIIEAVIKKYSIDYYLPHPRDEYKITNANYIKTDLISEDYFLKQIEKNCEIRYVFYGFFTTSFFTLVQIKDVQINAIYIKNDSVFFDKKDLFDLMKNLGINIISFDKEEDIF